MKHVALLLFVIWLIPLAYGQENDTLFIKSNYTKREVYIPMRDGVKLFTAIYEPKDQSTDYPILIIRSPYSSAPYGEQHDKIPLGPNKLYAREGFVFVYQDVRGKYLSEGDFVANRPQSLDGGTDESTDAYDTIDWLVKNIKSNKKVGVWGVSSPGMYASLSLINSHPCLKAVSPQAPVTDWFLGDDRHHNGAFMLMGTFSFLSSFGKPRDSIGTRGPAGFYAYNTTDSYDFYLKAGALKNLNERYLKYESTLWNEMMANPNYNEYWEQRNYLKFIKKVDPHVLVVGGWFDQEDLYGPLKTYGQLAKYNADNLHFVMGPWYHGSWMRFDGDSLGKLDFGMKTGKYYREQVELPFFKKHLKDQEQEIAPVQVFYTGGNAWKSYPSWPPPSAIDKGLYLTEAGKLSFERPTDIHGQRSYVSDPDNPVPYTNEKTVYRGHKYMFEDQHFAAKRPDVLVFETEPLETDVTVGGNIRAKLFISSTGTDADFVVKLIDVHPYDPKDPMADYQLLVRGDVFRAKYRNSFSDPQPLVAHEVTELNFELQDAAHVFRKGHRIMVQIQSSWFPLVDRNPQQFVDIYQADDDAFTQQTHTIYVNREHPSQIVLPIILADEN